VINWQDVTTWHILVVDDEQDNLEVVAETLEYKGATVQTAINGEDALKVLESFSANLILTDLSMPVMDGWKMRYQIKSNENLRDIPVIALSAHAIAGDQQRALEVGFNGYLTKPVNIHTLLDDIRLAYIEPEADDKAEIKTDDKTEEKTQ
jgi:CheY-like chemotaxis protein